MFGNQIIDHRLQGEKRQGKRQHQFEFGARPSVGANRKDLGNLYEKITTAKDGEDGELEDAGKQPVYKYYVQSKFFNKKTLQD